MDTASAIPMTVKVAPNVDPTLDTAVQRRRPLCHEPPIHAVVPRHHRPANEELRDDEAEPDEEDAHEQIAREHDRAARDDRMVSSHAPAESFGDAAGIRLQNA